MSLADPCSMILSHGPKLRYIVKRDFGIGVTESSIWCLLEDCVQIVDRMMIQRPLYGNWITFAPEFRRNYFHLLYSEHVEAPPFQQNLRLKHAFHQRFKMGMKSW